MQAMLVHGPVDAFFLVLHSGLILFVLFGWLWPGARGVHHIVVLAVGGSWFGFAAVYGWGYCPLTDWHYRVLADHGVTGLPPSYVAHLVERLSGWRPPGALADAGVVAGYVLAAVASLTTARRSA